MTTQKIPEIIIVNGQPTVTSRQIAEDFEKSHFHVIRDIEESEVSDKFRETNFGLSEYKIEGQSRKYKQYILTRDGFTIIAMGYKGKKAMQFKEDYIAAFNLMENTLCEDEVEPITAKQLQKIREAIQNCTRYMKHSAASLAQTMYRNMKKEFGYDKIECMPEETFSSAIDWIKNYELVCHQYYMAVSEVERNFISTMKQQDFEKAAEIGSSVLVEYKNKNLLEANVVH